MSIRYNKVRKKPTTFNRLFGISVAQFDEILRKVEPQWQKKIIAAYKRPGRDYKLEVAEMLLLTLLYYRSYITQEFVGYLFGIDNSRVCRIMQKLEPILAKVMAISKCNKLSKEEVESLIIDATEQQIERPKKKQKAYYSGKKKRHTLKTEIRITKKGRIVRVSRPSPGSVHDFEVYKKEPPPPRDSKTYLDSGYQGARKRNVKARTPYKASKNKSLTYRQKQYNRALSRIRIKVENIIGNIKTFRILSERYRNKRKRYYIKVNIIAGLVNMKNGFVAT